MSDREMMAFDERLMLVLAAEKAEMPPLRMADLVPEDVTIVPRDCDLANHPGYEEIHDAS